MLNLPMLLGAFQPPSFAREQTAWLRLASSLGGPLFDIKAHCRSLGFPGRPIRGFESEQRVRFSAEKIACGAVVATNLYGPSGFARDDKV